jgi:hypothetical protein
MDISLDWNGEPGSEIEKALERIRDWALDEGKDLAHAFHHKLEDAYLADTEDEAVIDCLENNDYKFNKDGEII